jgi:hypothetical protein
MSDAGRSEEWSCKVETKLAAESRYFGTWTAVASHAKRKEGKISGETVDHTLYGEEGAF